MHTQPASELVRSPSENDSGSLSRNLGLVRHVVFSEDGCTERQKPTAL